VTSYAKEVVINDKKLQGKVVKHSKYGEILKTIT